MSLNVSVIDGMTNVTDDDLSGFQTDFLSRAGYVELPQYTTPFKGSQTGTPNKFSNVAAGVFYIPNSITSPTQYFRIVNTASIAVEHDDPSANPRIDAVVLFLDLGAPVNANADNVASIEVIKGSEAGVPVAPSDSDITTALGADTWVRLYTVAISNPFVSIVNANITDLRPEAGIDTTKLGTVHNGILSYLFDKDVHIRGTAPVLRFEETDGSSNNKNWQFAANGEGFEATIWNDAYSSGAVWMFVERTGDVVNDITWSNYGATAFRIRENWVETDREIRAYENGGATYTSLIYVDRSVWFSGVGYNVIQGGAGGLIPATDNTYILGKSGSRWTEVWAANGTIQTSDITQKDVQDVEMLGLNFLMELEPIAYKWKSAKKKVFSEGQLRDAHGELEFDNGGDPVIGEIVEHVEKTEEEKRIHYGLSAQQVEEKMIEAGLTDMDFAGLIKDSETEEYGLRYDQFIPILIKAVQELHTRLAALE